MIARLVFFKVMLSAVGHVDRRVHLQETLHKKNDYQGRSVCIGQAREQVTEFKGWLQLKSGATGQGHGGKRVLNLDKLRHWLTPQPWQSHLS
jgi:hypothetical protein